MNRIDRLIHCLKEHLWLNSAPINEWVAQRALYIGPEQYEYDGEKLFVSQGDWLINSGTTMFLEKEIQVPQDFIDQSVGLVFAAGGRGEGLLYINGHPYHGLDRNRVFIPLPDEVVKSGSFAAKIELFNPVALPLDLLNDQVPRDESAPPPLYLLQSKLVVPNNSVHSLLLTVQLYQGVAKVLPEGDRRRAVIESGLNAIMDSLMGARSHQFQNQAFISDLEQSFLSSLGPVSDHAKAAPGVIRMVGQSHIDLAWLWPLNETIRKASRTFSTACTLLDTYPGFVYAQSQPQLYEYTKRHYPAVYERIKQKVAEGRWEIVGGMWVEPDLNIPSGESLVRQLLLGKRFFKQEFDANPRIEWLPDTFGYCASLPQLLKKAGIDYFMTTKMNWNDTNPFPYDLFYWVGIDGTKVLSFVHHGLGEHTKPDDVVAHWDSFKQKDLHPEQMLLYGHGDGGGGVTREMVEYVNRSKALPGLPSCVHSTAHDFFDGVRDADPSLPEWVGDLYLELHRGTYTTHARTKRWNRKAEVLYREAEIWSSFAVTLGLQDPSETLEHGWKLILLNQFHDIIPGSSIREVYEKSEQDYREVFDIGESVLHDALTALASTVDTSGPGSPLVVFNSLSWERTVEVRMIGDEDLFHVELVDSTGELLKVDVYQNLDGNYELCAMVPAVPPMGYKTIFQRRREQGRPTAMASETPSFCGAWSTPNYDIEWNDAGGITRLYDKKAAREVIPPGSVANELQLFHDRPTYWDAWDVDPRFALQRADDVRLTSCQVVLRGQAKDILRFSWAVGDSTVTQDVVLHHHSMRIDFVTRVDWHEAHKLLKVAFPVNVLSSKATYEIPFGSVERPTHTNTSWERAQFEVCGHRWADISEAGYGVSLLNDCKYGYDVKQNVLRLSLLRAPKWPDPDADQGLHEFVYSLFPHEGDWRAAGVVREGYELNHPAQIVSTTSHQGDLPSTHSLLTANARHVIVDTVKRAEDGHGLIVRLYESAGGRESAGLMFNLPIRGAQVTNLLEEPECDLETLGSSVYTQLKPFEVQTIKISM
ncbi:MAG: alpha-mannosidase [Alicyclobacillus sp.]|nr:alpha-mannosidase [Alicyclobacillus sp.]